MSRVPSLSVIFVVWGSALGLACPMVSSQIPDASRADSTLPQLLQPAKLVHLTSRIIGPEVVRRQGVRVDFELVKTLDPEGDNQIVFNLFPDTTFTGRIEGKTFPCKLIGFPDAFSLRGIIQGIPGSSFQLLYLQGALAADIRVPGKGEYQIRPTAAPGPPTAYEVWKIDSSRFPSCAAVRPHQFNPPPADKGLGQSTSSLVEDGSIIDVMIVYTTDARFAVGGEINVILESAFAVIHANEALANSAINTELRLVFLGELPYPESGSASTDLSRLTSTNDGFLDNMHIIRDAVGADIVSLFVSSLDACGTSWLMSDVSPAFQSFSFNVSAINCAAVNLTYAHEVGHNLGCQHNREDASGVQGAFPYSFGYLEPSGSFRTVMGSPKGSPRVKYFSNPLVHVGGVSTGVPEGQTNSADNAKTINNTAFTVANFRSSLCSTHADCNSNCIEDIDEIAIGISHDCNDNNIPDECEDDCNGNGIADTCDLADGGSSDCNSNSIPDECDVRNTFTIASTSGELSPIGLGFPVSHTFTSPPEATEDVTLRFAAIADIGSIYQLLDVYLNDVFLGHIYRFTGSFCPTTPDEDEIVIPMADFNTLVNGGDAVIRIETFDGIAFDACGGTSWVSVSLSNQFTRVGVDVNNNGIPDSCEPALALGDSNFDGVINITDLLNLLAAWGVCDGCVEDTNGDGLVNATDLLTLLANWGAI